MLRNSIGIILFCITFIVFGLLCSGISLSQKCTYQGNMWIGIHGIALNIFAWLTLIWTRTRSSNVELLTFTVSYFMVIFSDIFGLSLYNKNKKVVTECDFKIHMYVYAISMTTILLVIAKLVFIFYCLIANPEAPPQATNDDSEPDLDLELGDVQASDELTPPPSYSDLSSSET